MKRNTLRWFDHLERKRSEEFVKKLYVSKIEGPRKRKKDGRIW